MVGPPGSRFLLFVPNKTQDPVAQPKYGNDMRAIEKEYNTFVSTIAAYVDNLQDEITTLQTQVATLQAELLTRPNMSVLSWTVGGAPPAGTQFQEQAFEVSVDFVSGYGFVPVSGFSYGYQALVGSQGNVTIPLLVEVGPTSEIDTLVVVIFELINPEARYTGSATIEVRLVGA